MTAQRQIAVALPRLLVLAAALLAAGCASGGRPIEPGFGTAQTVQVTVENQNFKDAVVYAIWRAGSRDRLGMVTGNTTQTLTADLRGTGDLRIEVDFIAGDDVVTQSLGVFQGDQVHVRIPPNL